MLPEYVSANHKSVILPLVNHIILVISSPRGTCCTYFHAEEMLDLIVSYGTRFSFPLVSRQKTISVSTNVDAEEVFFMTSFPVVGST